MKPSHVLPILVLFLFVLCNVSAKRYGSSNRGSSSGSRFSWGNRKKQPSNSHQSAPTTFSKAPPSNPPGNLGFTQEHHQKSSSRVIHSSPYDKQPASNPYLGNKPHAAPYPPLQPNHPHPNPGSSSSSYPSISHQSPYSSSSSGGGGGGGGSMIHPQTHSTVQGSAPLPYHNGQTVNYGPPINHHPPSNPYPHSAGGYHQYPPATAPFVPNGHSTVYVVPSSSKTSSSSGGPGLGTYIGSAVAGGVAAGATNAIVDHAISSIFRPSSNQVHTYPSAPPVGTPTTVTHITNNYYGNNATNQAQPATGTNTFDQPPQAANPAGTQANPGPASTDSTSNNQRNRPTETNGAVNRAPEGQQENPPSNDNVISDDNLMKFTEELFDKQDKNLNESVKLNLQKRVTNVALDQPVPDEAPERLFDLKSELNTIPTVVALGELYNKFQRDGWQKENITSERKIKEITFLDEILKTPVMSRTIDWLVEKKYIENDDNEKKDALRRTWFSIFNDTSSGFERIFMSEKFGDSGIIGLQNWLYFAHLESQNNVNYLGYVDQISLSGKGSLLKLHYKTEGFTIQNATIFVGTTPELELALYTVCFYARSNNWCPISLGGAKFFILTHSFRYFGKDLIDIGFPSF